jgi:hypothetical protein
LETLLESASSSGVKPDLVERILDQENIHQVIQNDLKKTGQIGYREVWRLGLITPEQDIFKPRSLLLPRSERISKFVKDFNYRSNFEEQIPLTRTAVLNHIGAFNLQPFHLTVGWIRQKRKQQGKIYRLESELRPNEFINIRHIRIDRRYVQDIGRSQVFHKFLQEDGFPLKDTYIDGDPLTTERGGTVVIDQGKISFIYPQYYFQRRLIDNYGNLIYIGLDESYQPGTMLQVKILPSVSEPLFHRIQRNGYIPILRYRSFPYTCKYMLPIIDTPMSASGWAELFIGRSGKAKLYTAKEKTQTEWEAMMEKLRLLLFDELAKKDYHFLGLTQDKTHLDQYLAKKYEILRDYFIIKEWEMPT